MVHRPRSLRSGAVFNAVYIISKSGRHAASSITAASATANAASKYRLRSKNTIIRSFFTSHPSPRFCYILCGQRWKYYI